MFWYLAYRDANRVKFNFDLLLGNVEPKTFLPPSLSLSLSRSRSLPSSSSVRWAGQSLLLESPPVPPRCGSSTNIGSGQSPRFARGFRLETHRPECYSCRVTETAAISGRFLSYPVFQQHATCSFLSAPRNRRRLHVSFSFRKRPRFRPRFPHLVSSRLPFLFPPSLLTPRRTPTDGRTGRQTDHRSLRQHELQECSSRCTYER